MATQTSTPDLSNLRQLVSLAEYDASQLASGKKSAATALRKKLSSASKEITKLRAQALAFQKSIPTKSRKAKAAEPEPVAAVDGGECDEVEECTDGLDKLELVRDPPKMITAPKKKRGRKPKKVLA